MIRPDKKMMLYKREVLSWEEFLGDIAGLYELIIVTLSLLFGKVITYLTKLHWIRGFYIFKTSHTSDHTSKDIGGT